MLEACKGSPRCWGERNCASLNVFSPRGPWPFFPFFFFKVVVGFFLLSRRKGYCLGEAQMLPRADIEQRGELAPPGRSRL